MFKRALDILISLMLILVLMLPMLITALAVRLAMGSPVLFRQVRPGYRGRLFDLVKFRTMTAETERGGVVLTDELRLTRLGRFLRRASLDELPQLWNVLLGDMSLVGPRPLLVEYLPLYSPEQARRHEVRPGITGWAQINGRNAQTWEERLRLDVWYVDHRSFGLDMKILWCTFLKVLRSEGVNQPGHATMPRFTGSRGESRNG